MEKFKLQQFLGDWELTRSISNGFSMHGVASLMESGSVIEYREHGSLNINKKNSISFSKSYFFYQNASSVCIYFDKKLNSIFHKLIIEREDGYFVGRNIHLCGDDFYKSEYKFADDDRFQITHIVQGPAKDYKIYTEYNRSAVFI